MLVQQAIAFVTDDIAEVGALMRDLSGRYEAIFANLRSALAVTLAQAATMADAAREATAIADAASAAIRDHIPNQPALACASGCSPCCHLYVQVPPGTAASMVAHIDATFTPMEREALQARLTEAAATLGAATDPAALRLRCPLLGTDDRCTVYAVRPLSCRAFTSTSLPRCQQVVFGNDPSAGGVAQNAAHFRIHLEATSALEQAARDRGLPDAQQPLAQALLEEWRGPAI
ncbi:YkgJ family cysteine cluster protein [Rhodopseudomonas sp. P2A-2r]|uniref:YkgJ family cysteine cluster protein n=1 Tax=unclassified Rhodopseudomonas TaxID=2638247 RepID=UPI00223483AC|nr:YkgJ family cysteine cluster protein [Rhodopseudomonas sp. P2A-2r]UZE51598.1 YkgJ family cysteine cluster protein [Rhodopseudomonas sp. P2A-2r]